MKDLKILLEKYSNLNKTYQFVSADRDIWELGTLPEIKQKVSNEAFTFHIAVNMIGNWQSDGWSCLFAEKSNFLPYISDALHQLHLTELKDEFDKMIYWLKTYFENAGISDFTFNPEKDETIDYDVVNFLINPRFKIEDKMLNLISDENRKIASEKYRRGINKLDDIAEKFWGYKTKEEGWESVIQYIEKHNS